MLHVVYIENKTLQMQYLGAVCEDLMKTLMVL
jgi:hypothetical protein